MVDWRSIVGANVRRARREANLTQEQLAFESQIDLTYVGGIALAVGTDCCDRLTVTSEASEFHDAMLKARNARARFVSSKRWKDHPKGGITIVQKGINVRVIPSNGKFRVSMNSIAGKIEYDTMIDAKLKVYESIMPASAARLC